MCQRPRRRRRAVIHTNRVVIRVVTNNRVAVIPATTEIKTGRDIEWA